MNAIVRESVDFIKAWTLSWAFLVAQLVKNVIASAEYARDVGPVPGSERSPGEGNGNPLQGSCLGNPMDSGAWWVTIHVVAKCQTRRSTRALDVPYVHICDSQTSDRAFYHPVFTQMFIVE